VSSGDFYFNGDKGLRMLTNHAPTPKTTAKQETRSGNNENVWSENDVIAAVMILDQLLTKQHVQQGIVIRDLISALKVPKEQEQEFRHSLRRVERAGLVIIDKNTNPNTRSGHSKRLFLPGIKFPNQAAKERWKRERETVIKELQSLVC
jgi:hypothetical protein